MECGDSSPLSFLTALAAPETFAVRCCWSTVIGKKKKEGGDESPHSKVSCDAHVTRIDTFSRFACTSLAVVIATGTKRES